uniref:WRKY19-like zinc finger domain-containing protein n=1 Tax=Peronospora matthiolae TaxID=2874970 RepID=A0AAV1T5H5_9STRA
MLTAPMTPHQWTMKQASKNIVLMGQSNDLKRQQRSSCSPAIILSNISSAIATSPCLPSLGNISPANTTTTARFPVMRTNNLMNPLKLEYCSFQGCANFSKMQGYCHDHIHGQPAPHSSQTAFVPTGTNPPLPGLGLPSTVTPLPYLPALQTVVPTQTQATGVRPSLCLSGYPSYNDPMYTTTPALHINKRSSIFNDRTNFLSGPLTKRPRVGVASPTLSTGSIGSYRSITRCRRDGCNKDARRKGLCMEHGGRHFCKMTGCQKCAHRGGFCISHGGGRRCAVANCSKSAQSGGICYSHGGGKRCGTGGCTHAARSGGFCIKHGKQQQQQQLKRRW